MSTKKKNRTFLLWVITSAAFLITAIAVQFMADSVPMHYNGSGEIDRYGSKYENFVFPVMIFVFNVFWVLFIRFYRKKEQNGSTEKKRKEAGSNVTVIEYAAIGTSLMFVIMQCMFLIMAISASEGQTNAQFDIDVICNVLMGALIIFLGNILPKTKRNSAVGMRTIWSMDNDKTWEMSNRFAGKTMMASGVLIIFESIIIKGLTSTFIELGIIIAMLVVCCIQSYQVYKKYGNKSTTGV